MGAGVSAPFLLSTALLELLQQFPWGLPFCGGLRKIYFINSIRHLCLCSVIALPVSFEDCNWEVEDEVEWWKTPH